MAKTPLGYPGSTFYAWQCHGHPWRTGSYGINSYSPFVFVDRHKSIPPDILRNMKGIWEDAYQKGADNIPLLLDSVTGQGFCHETDLPPEFEGRLAFDLSSFCFNRHDGGINSLFLDFSIRKVGLKELWTLKWHRNFNTAGPCTRAGGVKPEEWPEWMRKFKDY
jgi:prepilin-type processing-associated H-X9-DG protein